MAARLADEIFVLRIAINEILKDGPPHTLLTRLFARTQVYGLLCIFSVYKWVVYDSLWQAVSHCFLAFSFDMMHSDCEPSFNCHGILFSFVMKLILRALISILSPWWHMWTLRFYKRYLFEFLMLLYKAHIFRFNVVAFNDYTSF